MSIQSSEAIVLQKAAVLLAGNEVRTVLEREKDMELRDKAALVTGSSGDIGGATLGHWLTVVPM